MVAWLANGSTISRCLLESAHSELHLVLLLQSHAMPETGTLEPSLPCLPCLSAPILRAGACLEGSSVRLRCKSFRATSMSHLLKEAAVIPNSPTPSMDAACRP